MSLTFDDGRATAYNARELLNAHDVRATFYLNSAHLGTSSFYLTKTQAKTLFDDGNEIGGHDSHHARLTILDADEARRQICYDRNTLLSMGYPVSSFAYPFGSFNEAVAGYARDCGYNSARTTNTVTSGAPSESIPPADAYGIRLGTASMDISSMQSAVTSAVQAGGGWVPLMFHDICDACSTVSNTAEEFSDLLDWLDSQQQNGVIVRTVGQVMGGSPQPSIGGPDVPQPVQGVSLIHNSSLEHAADGYVPDCFAQDAFGDSQYTWSRVRDAHTGTFAQSVEVTAHRSGSVRLLIKQDLGACTPTVTAGHRYRLETWYKSTAPVTFQIDKRTETYAFRYWGTSPSFPATNTWTKATWVTPAVPADVNGLSFGLSLGETGGLVVDDVRITDAETATTDSSNPTVSISTPETGVTVGGVVSVSFVATDDLALNHVELLVDGIPSGAWVTGPSVIAWRTRGWSNGTHSLTVRAEDTSGNFATTATTPVFVSNQTTNLIGNPSVEQASGLIPSCWLLGGYGTNTYNWTRSTDAHSGAYSQSLQISAWSSGDRKLVSAQGSGSCAPAITSGRTYSISAWLKGTLPSYFYAYYRDVSGSWLYLGQSTKLVATSGWQQLSWTTPSLPARATHLSVGLGGSSTGVLAMDDFALYDNTPLPDAIAPTSAVSCDEGQSEESCGWFFTDKAQVRLTAIDDEGGSGVSEIRYTTDGSEPSRTNGSVYSGPFGAMGTVKWRAYDLSGNAEAVRSQEIRVDSVAPTSTIVCQPGCNQVRPGFAVTLSATDDHGGSGVSAIKYTVDGSIPAVDHGRTYVGAFSVTRTTAVKFRAIDQAGNLEDLSSVILEVDSQPPSSRALCDDVACGESIAADAVVVRLSAQDGPDGSGVAHIEFTLDGTQPSGDAATYATEFTLANTTTVNYRAIDEAGNTEPWNTVVVKVDRDAPQTTALCNERPCTADAYREPVSISLAADDGSSGSGVSSIRFTLDGSDPTMSAGSRYSTPMLIAESATIRFRSYDTAGNAEPVRTVTVHVDASQATEIPQPSSSCDGVSCGLGYHTSAVSYSLQVAGGGQSPPYQIRYTTDDSEPTLVGGHEYHEPLILMDTTTVRSRAFDGLGVAGPLLTERVSIDSAQPGVTIICNGSPCGSEINAKAVSVVLTADDGSGSGVSQIRYTTDGSTPSASSGRIYSGSFSISTTTMVNYLAVDRAGNASEVTGRRIVIDSVPPTSTITCNGAACAASFYSSRISVGLQADDNEGGSGIAEIRYTIDGSEPTSSNGRIYSEPIELGSSLTLLYRAFDLAGNAEPLNSAVLSLDTEAPNTRMQCDGLVCSSAGYRGPVTVSLIADDGHGGSGVAATRYTLDGTEPTHTSGKTYDGPFKVLASTTVIFRSIDMVGHSEPTQSQRLIVDTAAPTVAIASPIGDALIGGTVTVTTTVDDNEGVDHVQLLVDGQEAGSDASAPFAVDWDTSGVSDGVHTLNAVAFDDSGNSGTSNAVLVVTGNSNVVANASMESASGITPNCWQLGGRGTNSYSWSRTIDAHSGTFAQELTITSLASGDRKLVTMQDSGHCAPVASAGDVFQLSAWYRTDLQPYFFVYYRTAAGWVYWTSSGKLAAAPTWTRGTFRTPPVPLGATHLSFGLGIDGVGRLVSDDFAAFRLSQ